jgi:hypothetical protein
MVSTLLPLRELNELRAQRVQARRNIERAHLIFPDPLDRRQFVEHQTRLLRGTQRRWQELHLLLGRALPGPAVRLRAR